MASIIVFFQCIVGDFIFNSKFQKAQFFHLVLAKLKQYLLQENLSLLIHLQHSAFQIENLLMLFQSVFKEITKKSLQKLELVFHLHDRAALLSGAHR